MFSLYHTTFWWALIAAVSVEGINWPWKKSSADSKISCGQNSVTFKRGTPAPKKTSVRTSQGEEIVLVNSKSQQIVNGHDAAPHAWPWMVSVRKRSSSSSPADDLSLFEHHCGGVLITEQVVLTAAHCFAGTLPANDYQVKAGAHYLNGNDAKKDKEGVYDIDRYKVHGLYNPESQVSENDIAIMVLTKKVPFDENVSPTCVAEPGQLTTKSSCVVTGWGNTENFGENSNVLQQLELPILDNNTCKASSKGRFNATTQFCAGYVGGDKDTCQGDSGGPVVCKNKDNEPWRLEGLVSYGDLCAKGKPGFYTRVVTYKSWILKNIPCDSIFCKLFSHD